MSRETPETFPELVALAERYGYHIEIRPIGDNMRVGVGKAKRDGDGLERLTCWATLPSKPDADQLLECALEAMRELYGTVSGRGW